MHLYLLAMHALIVNVELHIQRIPKLQQFNQGVVLQLPYCCISTPKARVRYRGRALYKITFRRLVNYT